MKITIPRPKRKLELKDVNISAKKIEEIIQQEVSECLEHFSDTVNGGWKLDKSWIKNEIFYKIFDVVIEEEIDQAFINEGLSVSYEGGSSFVELKEGYKPIYFNEKTGKLKVVENADDKSYLFKYTANKGWHPVGRL